MKGYVAKGKASIAAKYSAKEDTVELLNHSSAYDLPVSTRSSRNYQPRRGEPPKDLIIWKHLIFIMVIINFIKLMVMYIRNCAYFLYSPFILKSAKVVFQWCNENFTFLCHFKLVKWYDYIATWCCSNCYSGTFLVKNTTGSRTVYW